MVVPLSQIERLRLKDLPEDQELTHGRTGLELRSSYSYSGNKFYYTLLPSQDPGLFLTVLPCFLLHFILHIQGEHSPAQKPQLPSGREAVAHSRNSPWGCSQERQAPGLGELTPGGRQGPA